MRAIQKCAYFSYFYIGVDFLPYQIAFGFSVRYLDDRLHFRIYIGPLKFYGGCGRQRVKKIRRKENKDVKQMDVGAQ